MKFNLFYYIFFLPVLVFSSMTVGAQCTLSIDSIRETNPISCNGVCDGEITVYYSGAFGNVSFQWMDAQNNNLGVNSAILSGSCAGVYSVSVTDANNCIESSSFTLSENDAISYSVTRTNTTCSGSTGEFVFVANGGCGTYQYSLDGGSLQSSGTFSSLDTGFYAVTISDNCGCSSSFTEFISSTDGPTITPNFIEPVCFGEDNGSISIFAFGSGTITYSIDGGTTSGTNNVFTNLSPGTYPVVVQDGAGCKAFVVIEMTEPDSIRFSTDLINETCVGNNGSIEFHPVGGTGAFQFELNGGGLQSDSLFTGLSGGNQTYLLEDVNGCQVTGQISLTTGGGPTISNIVTTNPTCSDNCNGAVLITANGNGTLTFDLDTISQSASSFTGICSGNYLLSITDGDGCTSTQNVSLTAPTAPIADFSVSDTSGVSPLTAVFSNSSVGATNYNWSFGDSLSSTSTETDPSFTFLNIGTYAITMIAENGACTDTAWISITVTGEPGITVPNVFTPNADGVNDIFRPIMVGISSVEGSIFNRWGEKVYEWFGNNGYWDGYTHPAGQIAPEGVYYYVISAIDLNDVSYEKQGVVYLMR